MERVLKATGFRGRWISWVMGCISDPCVCCSVEWIIYTMVQVFYWAQTRLSAFTVFVYFMLERSFLFLKGQVGFGIDFGYRPRNHPSLPPPPIVTKATNTQCLVFKALMEVYCKLSGQNVNDYRTSLCISPCISPSRKKSICEILGCMSNGRVWKYLGSPIKVKRLCNIDFSDLSLAVSKVYHYNLMLLRERIEKKKVLRNSGYHITMISIIERYRDLHRQT